MRDQIHHGEADQLVGDFIRLAAEVCSAPVAVLSVVRSDSVHHISRFGSSSDNTYDSAGEDALVSRAIRERRLYVVPDSLKDRRFKDDVPATERGAVRFYAGAPLLTPEESMIGVLSIVDHRPRQLTATEKRTLCSLASAVMVIFELSRKSVELEQAKADREKAFESLRASEDRDCLHRTTQRGPRIFKADRDDR